ncbi:unnamed protein product [Brassica oleracea]
MDNVWDEDTVHELYKGPMPKWFSHDALALDSKKYYVVPESELHDNDWLQLLMECLDAYLPLELNSVVVETFEDKPRDKLMAINAIYYLSYKCCVDPCSTPLAGNHLAIIRKTMDGKPGHMSLEGFDLDFNSDPPTLIEPEWGEEYDIGLYGRIGLQCHNLQKGTNFKFKRWEKHSMQMTGSMDFYVTLEAMDPANGSVFSFQTLLRDQGRRSPLGVRFSLLNIVSRITPIGNVPVDHHWDKDPPAIHDFYKSPLPKWFSDEALACDSKKYYVVPESELHDTTCFNFSWKSPSSPKQIVVWMLTYPWSSTVLLWKLLKITQQRPVRSSRQTMQSST